jgi:glyoxalase family protein
LQECKEMAMAGAASEPICPSCPWATLIAGLGFRIMQHNGIHHVTAIAGPAARNLAFYTRTLGLRLVKKTVNFDDPGTYHLYYGDEQGQPGTILTFFPWEHAAPGRLGVGQTQETMFKVPADAIGWWRDHLTKHGVAHRGLTHRFGEGVLAFQDPDGMPLSFVGVPGAESEPAWSNGAIPADQAIRGFHGVSLLQADAAPTGAILSDVFGLTEVAREGSVVRYAAIDAWLGGIVDVEVSDSFLPGRMGGGSVHHIAFRAADDAEQARMVERLAQDHQIQTTEQKDRNYFRSVYFREPGGILFEIATDEPGFAVDEPVASLGQALKLPRSLERHRGEIEAALPALG